MARHAPDPGHPYLTRSLVVLGSRKRSIRRIVATFLRKAIFWPVSLAFLLRMGANCLWLSTGGWALGGPEGADPKS
jgi:hypothetical protein